MMTRSSGGPARPSSSCSTAKCAIRLNGRWWIPVTSDGDEGRRVSSPPTSILRIDGSIVMSNSERQARKARKSPSISLDDSVKPPFKRPGSSRLNHSEANDLRAWASPSHVDLMHTDGTVNQRSTKKMGTESRQKCF